MGASKNLFTDYRQEDAMREEQEPINKSVKKKSVNELNGLQKGQEITWRCELRGGYGRIIFVKAKVVKLNPKKCRIEVPLLKGGIKQTNVDYANIKESNIYVKTFMELRK